MTTNLTEAELAGLTAALSVWRRPCPTWCASAGQHVWQVLPNGRANRFHSAETTVVPANVEDAGPIRVRPHAWETETDPQLERAVQIATCEDSVAELCSRAEVETLVLALLQAAHDVFPEQYTAAETLQSDHDARQTLAALRPR